MGDAAFQSVWRKVGELEGAAFRSANGVEFTYRFGRTYVVISAGGLSIPRTHFEKVFRRLREHGTPQSPPLPGQTFILGILTDPRLS